MNAREIDEMLGTPARLAIMATLAQVESLAFTELGRETGLADGNLHVQTRKLLAAGYLAGAKGLKGKRRVTCFSLTELGRERFRAHIRMLALAGGLGPIHEKGPLPRRVAGRRKAKDDSRVW